ncbi:hypothetical protein AB0I66_00135 [Streptomyces sp. NPDC050439]|uniref:hypothetical protein n=1 Tax=unclassified Streptomyces TaxID=2593676 RepID=UPI003446B130
MAGDRFTQIAHALFRDPRISFKAKGIFGLISTHRDGWRITLSELARCGPDGSSAVRSGLKELQTFGYLIRERERREDGTLGEVVYAITDAPAHLYDLLGEDAPAAAAIAQSRRAQPGCDFPTLGHPTLGDRPTKNTSLKKTIQQNTNSVRPSVRNAHARGPAGAAPSQRSEQPQGRQQVPPAGKGGRPSAGERLLKAIGARQPELLLTGQALTDQGRVVQGLLETGWTPQQLRQVIAARPLPKPLRHTVGAIIAARLRSIQDTTPPDHAAAPPLEPTPTRTDAAAGSVADAVARRALVECAGCGSPSRAPGQDLCPACLNWPACTACTGPTPRRADPQGDGRCTLCAT